MKAIRYHEHGDADVLTVDDVPTPEPGHGEALVRVHAASVNPIDTYVREGGVDVVHWVDADENVPVTMRTMDGDVEGHAEPGVEGYAADNLLQFERVGFCRLDAFEDGELTAYFTHT